ncbi:MAG: adenylyl-sulfate kinase, partial [Bacteroidales bacterium]
MTLNQYNLSSEKSLITPERRLEMLGHKPATIWLTGLSGSGKSTLARLLEWKLTEQRIHAYILDGDNLRRGLNADLGFSPEARDENIRRVAEVAKLMNDAGIVVIAAFISPTQKHRALAANIIGASFYEIFVDA